MNQHEVVPNESGAAGQDRSALIAFGVLIVIGGSNAVAVRFSNFELPPFWGAAIRFAAAGLIFCIIVLSRRIAWPKGRALVGDVVYGLLSVGAAYAFLYWGLLRLQAGLTMVVLAFVPLLTLLFAVAHGLEPFRWRGLVGALVALAGIVLAAYGGLGSAVHLPSLLAVFAGAVCIAEAAVVFKLFPQSHPVATNAVAVSIGALLLFGLSILAGEQWQLPTTSNTWVAFAYLVLVGSVLLFYLYLFVLSRWEASVTAYSFLLFPVTTVIIAALLAGESITISFAIGGAIVLVGVWLGAIKRAPISVAADLSAPPEELLP